MKRIILIFGLIIGVILVTNAIIMVYVIYSDPDFKGNDLVGYAKLVIMFSLIYIGVRNYRNNHLDGIISFGKAMKTGAWICFAASTVYTIIGLAHYYLFVPDFAEVFTNHVIRNSAPEDVEAVTAQMTSFKELYKNPLFAILITYLEVLPVGMIVALVSAFAVKKK